VLMHDLSKMPIQKYPFPINAAILSAWISDCVHPRHDDVAPRHPLSGKANPLVLSSAPIEFESLIFLTPGNDRIVRGDA
jgi:hypothetical protein